MTREEAITVIKGLSDNPLFSDEHKQAFNIAIHDIKQRHDWDINNLILINKDDYEPLEQEPCEDTVSRKAVITIIRNHWWNCRDIDKLANDLPSITPQEQIEKCTWIKYDYRTVCPKEHDIDNPYWRIPENRMETLKYCPYCGKEIEVEEWKEKKQ